MEHMCKMKKKTYRNWLKAGLGLFQTKEGLDMFCDDLVKQQHTDILNQIKQENNLEIAFCRSCDLKNLKPNHVRTSNRQCPLGQVKCNCQYPNDKIACANNVCGAIYDKIICLHGSTPPAPNWKNTDITEWCSDRWSVAKCFINAPGYENKSTVTDIDCSGILQLFINNKGLHHHIQSIDSFSKVRKLRNDIFHCHTMELEDSVCAAYIDDMISVCMDSKELSKRKESQIAVENLRTLRKNDFYITTHNECEVVKSAVVATEENLKDIKTKIDELEQKESISSKIKEKHKNEQEIMSDQTVQYKDTASPEKKQELFGAQIAVEKDDIEVTTENHDKRNGKKRKASESFESDDETLGHRIPNNEKFRIIHKRVHKLESEMEEERQLKKEFLDKLSKLQIQFKEMKELRSSRTGQFEYLKEKAGGVSAAGVELRTRVEAASEHLKRQNNYNSTY